jgi:hypothetical protein
MRKAVLILVLVVAVAATSSHAATTYYIDSVLGQDSYTGLSMDKPWVSLSKVSSYFTGSKPDVSVLFKRGCVWTGQLTLSASGTPGHPFMLGAYGTGANPIINGTAYTHAILGNAVRDVIIDSVDVYGSKDAGMNFYGSGNHDIILRNLTVSCAKKTGIYIGGYNFTVENVSAHHNGTDRYDHGVYVGSGSGGSFASNVVLSGVNAYSNSGWGLHFWDSRSGEAKNCKVYSNLSGGIALGTSGSFAQDFYIHDSDVYNNSGNTGGFYLGGIKSGSVIRIMNNRIYNNTGGDIVQSSISSGATVTISGNTGDPGTVLPPPAPVPTPPPSPTPTPRKRWWWWR